MLKTKLGWVVAFGGAQVAALLILIPFAVLTAQPIPNGEPKIKTEPVKSDRVSADTPKIAAGIQELQLEWVGSSILKTETVLMKPHQLKAFVSGEGISWDVQPKSDGATEDGLAWDDLGPNCLVFGFNVDKQTWGKARVPNNLSALIVACNPKAKGVYTVSKSADVDGRSKVVAKVNVQIVRDGEPDPIKVDPIKPEPVKTFPKKLQMLVFYESSEKRAETATFIGDKELNDYWKSKGFDPIVMFDVNVKDKATNDTPENLKPYVQFIKQFKKNLPVVFLMNVDGPDPDSVYQDTRPSTAAEMLKIIKSKLGEK